jgi:pimeloyl-ACP methyl ester carboxylesterase
MNRVRLIALFLCLTFSGLSINAQEERAGRLVIEPHSFKTFDGREHAAELGKLWVRENRNSQSSRLIQLAFVRLKSTASQPGAPIIWLAGGPGTPGILMGRIPVYFSLFDKLREVADVILLDQRGSGMSVPNLNCPATPVPTDAFETAEKWLRAYSGMSRACAEHWRAQGVDLPAYTTEANADDIDDLRQALGAERISLIGHSYGTVLAQAVIRRHNDRLNRVVLASTDTPDTLLTLPSTWDMLFKKLSSFASEDIAVNKIAPDMEALYRRVLDKLERNPLTLAVTDAQTKRPVNIRVGKIGLQWLMRLNMGNDARTFSVFPALLYTIDQGDYSILTRQIESLYNGFQGRSAMANALDCSSGWSAERLAQVRREAPQALFGNVNLQWESDICKAVGLKRMPAPQPRVLTTLPALFLSGTLDTNTPPFQAEEVRWGFPNSTHVIIENSGHEMLPDSEVQSVVVDFFKGQDVSGRKVSFPRPRFVSVEQAKSSEESRR